MALTLAARSQMAPEIMADSNTLPLRNLQIEVRQLRDNRQLQNTLGASGTVLLQPGQSGGRVNITAQNSQHNDSGELVQRLLVLNGRSANIMLGNSVPLRLLQNFVHKGQVRYGSSTVLVDANSGFSAKPLWHGADSTELELAAVQSTGRTALLPATFNVVTTLVVPLNEWVAVAQSDEASANSNSGLFNSGQSAARSALTVQVRISVR